MKKKLLSIVFALLLIPVIASAEYFRDIIVTSTEGIWTDSRAYTTLADALVDIAIDGTVTDLYIAESETVGTMTVPAYIRLHFVHEGDISVTTQLIINTTQIFSGDRQIFTGVGDIDFIAGSVVRSSWFSDLDEALDVTNDDTLTMVISEAETLTGNCAVGNNVTLRWESPFIITTGAFTMSNIKNIEAGSYQLFAGATDFDFLAGSVLRSSWFSTLITAQAFTTDENVNLTILVDQPETTDNVTFDAFQSLAVNPGCLININTGQTITINSSISAGNYQIFADDGTVAGAIKQLIIPDDWFAGTETVTLTSSLDALDITESLATLGITATGAEINTSADGIATFAGFNVEKGAVQSNIATGSEIVVVWNTEIFDIGANFAANTFVASVSGAYQFNAVITLVDLDSAASEYSVSISIEGVPEIIFVLDPTRFSADIPTWSFSLSGLIFLAATNAVYVTVNQNGGAAQTDITEGYFTGFLIAR